MRRCLTMAVSEPEERNMASINQAYADAIAKARQAIKDAVKVSEESLPDVLNMIVDSFECEGHISLDGAHMGEPVYCDGSCRG